MTKLAYMIQRRGLKQNYIARQLGVSRQTVSNWVSGYTKMSADVLMRLTEILDCEPVEIYGFVDEPQAVEVE